MIVNTEVTWGSDAVRWDAYAQPVQETGELFIAEWFGPRCKEFDPDCECCRRWRLLDQLLENPFQDDESKSATNS